MKAAVYRKYGPPNVVQIEDVPTPVPKDEEILVRVTATTVSSADARIRSLKVPKGFGPFARPAFGVLGPRKKILGLELAGEVAAVGSRVTTFKVGDSVFAFPGIGLGCHAEYRVMPAAGRVLPVPAGLTPEAAAALSFGGTTALHFLREQAKVQSGERILIVGASGAVGSAAVQLARHFGAEVTAVTSSANVSTVRALGATHVIDYKAGPYLDGGRTYDVVLDAVGVEGYQQYRRSLAKGGRLLLAVASLPQMLDGIRHARGNGHRFAAGSSAERLEYMRLLAELAEAGAYKPLIDRRFPLQDAAAAHAYVDTGRKRGSVLLIP